MKFVLATMGLLLLCSRTTAQATEKKPDLTLFEKHTYSKEQQDLPYRFLQPVDYTAESEERYPLVIFLHGLGERGTDNERQLRNGVEQFATEANRAKHPCFLIVPQCPPDKLWYDIAAPGTRQNQPLKESPTGPGKMVLELIEKIFKEYPIDTSRIYLTGISQGGYGTWDLICHRPDLFAAAMPVCGGGDPAQAKKLVEVPIWCFHGDADRLVPVGRSRDMIAAIKEAGGKPNYTEYEGVGHDSWTPTYSDDAVMDWLFEQKKTE